MQRARTSAGKQAVRSQHVWLCQATLLHTGQQNSRQEEGSGHPLALRLLFLASLLLGLPPLLLLLLQAGKRGVQAQGSRGAWR